MRTTTFKTTRSNTRRMAATLDKVAEKGGEEVRARGGGDI
jgi:hypothetical protein